jgi:hypothetical protein
MPYARSRTSLAAITVIAATCGVVPVTLTLATSASAATAAKGSDHIGAFTFADAKRGKERANCGFKRGRLVRVSVSAPKVQPAASVKPPYHAQYISWAAKLQLKEGKRWRNVGSSGDKYAKAKVGRLTKLPSQPAFSKKQIHKGHRAYRVVARISWHSVKNYNIIQATATRTMANYRYPVATHNAGFCRNATPTSMLGTSISTYPGDTSPYSVGTDPDGNTVRVSVVSSKLNGSLAKNFVSPSGSHLIFHATEADFGHAATVEYRVRDSLGARSKVKTVSVSVQAPPSSSPPTAPGISVSNPSATQVSFSWGAGTPHGCSITGYAYQVNGGGWTGTSANAGVTLGTGYSQTYTVTVEVTDACGRSSTSSQSGTTNSAPPPSPAISIGWGSNAAQFGNWMDITFENFPTGSVTWYCVEEGHAYGPYSTSLSSSTETLTTNTCQDTESGGSDYVTADGVNSNTIGTD